DSTSNTTQVQEEYAPLKQELADVRKRCSELEDKLNQAHKEKTVAILEVEDLREDVKELRVHSGECEMRVDLLEGCLNLLSVTPAKRAALIRSYGEQVQDIFSAADERGNFTGEIQRLKI
ncbi:hypothetical protein DXG01_016771, partial [Tephrocybe rancida]